MQSQAQQHSQQSILTGSSSSSKHPAGHGVVLASALRCHPQQAQAYSTIHTHARSRGDASCSSASSRRSDPNQQRSAVCLTLLLSSIQACTCRQHHNKQPQGHLMQVPCKPNQEEPICEAPAHPKAHPERVLPAADCRTHIKGTIRRGQVNCTRERSKAARPCPCVTFAHTASIFGLPI